MNGPADRSGDASSAAVEAASTALREARERLAVAERALGQLEAANQEPPVPQRVEVEPTWRQRLWSAPAEARLGVTELQEALGVSESWVYRRTSKDVDPRLPHAKMGGSLVFKAGEIRAWIRDHESVEVAYRMESAPGELRAVEGGAT